MITRIGGRAFIPVLDEPFAALDESSTRRLVACLNHLLPNRGVLLAMHSIREGLCADGVPRFQEGRRIVVSVEARRAETTAETRFAESGPTESTLISGAAV